jgi:hypothetical protein
VKLTRLFAVVLLAVAAAASDAAEQHNLDVYSHPGATLPVLPWDDDLLIRLSFTA